MKSKEQHFTLGHQSRVFGALLWMLASVPAFAATSTAATCEPQRPGAQPAGVADARVLGEGIQDLADVLMASAARDRKSRVAIIPFRELSGEATVLGTYLAESLTTRLLNAGSLDIRERTLLDKIMAEMKLGASGAIDVSTAARIGNLAGVEAIVTGTVTEMPSSVAINCRLIDVATGRVLGAAETRVIKDEDLKALMSSSLSSPTSDPDTRKGNLVVNGDLTQHWSVGWKKQVDDPTQGSLVVENADGMLHVVLTGRNGGQVWQDVPVPRGRGIESLVLEAGVQLVPRRQGMLGLAPPVEVVFAVSFDEAPDRSLGQINFTQFATTGLEGSGLAGVPEPARGTGQQCMVPLKEGFNRLSERLDLRAKDCLARLDAWRIRSISIGVWMRTGNDASSAEAFLSQVRLAYGLSRR